MRKTTLLTLALLVALPAAMVMAGPVMKAYLCRTEDGGDTMRGKVKIKADRDGELHLFSVQIKNAGSGEYDVFLVDSEETDTDIGDISVPEGGDSGKLTFNTRRGDVLETDPVGMRVEVRSGEDVLLTAEVPDPTAPKVRGNAKAKLAAPETDPVAEDAKGIVHLKVNNGAHFLKVIAQRSPAGAYTVRIDGTDVGELVVDEGESSGVFKAMDRKGDAVPAGLDGYLDLAGLDIEVVRVVDEVETVLLAGTIPTLEKKGGPKK